MYTPRSIRRNPTNKVRPLLIVVEDPALASMLIDTKTCWKETSIFMMMCDEKDENGDVKKIPKIPYSNKQMRMTSYDGLKPYGRLVVWRRIIIASAKVREKWGCLGGLILLQLIASFSGYFAYCLAFSLAGYGTCFRSLLSLGVLLTLL